MPGSAGPGPDRSGCPCPASCARAGAVPGVVSGAGAGRGAGGESGVGGGVHDGGEGFVLFVGGEDFDVVESVAAPLAQERALVLAEDFFGRFGAVWSMESIQRLVMVVTKSGSVSIAVVVRACSIRVMVSSSVRCRTLSRAVLMIVADREGTSAEPTALRRGFRGGPGSLGRSSLSGGGRRGEGEPTAGFADTDPQPCPKELRRVPVPVIQNTVSLTGDAALGTRANR